MFCCSGSSVPIERLRVGDRVLALDLSTGALVASPVVAWLHRERRSSLPSSSSSDAPSTPFEYIGLELVRCPRLNSPAAPTHATLALAATNETTSREQNGSTSWKGCVRWSRLLVSPEHVLYTAGQVATYAKNVRVGQELPSLLDFDGLVQQAESLRWPERTHSNGCPPSRRTAQHSLTVTEAAASGTCASRERRDRFRWELRVRAIARGVRSAEAYAPLTETGTAFVDGALVSCYANHLPLPVELVHAAFAPLRALYRIRRAFDEFVNTLFQHLHHQHVVQGSNSNMTVRTTLTVADKFGGRHQDVSLHEYSDRFHWYARVLMSLRKLWQFATVIWTIA